MSPRFVRAIHRAHDVSAARAFYTAVLGAADLELAPAGSPPRRLAAAHSTNGTSFLVRPA